MLDACVDKPKWQPPLFHHLYSVWTALSLACKQEIIGN